MKSCRRSLSFIDSGARRAADSRLCFLLSQSSFRLRCCLIFKLGNQKFMLSISLNSGSLFGTKVPSKSRRLFVQGVMRSRSQNYSIFIPDLLPCRALRRITLTITKIIWLLDLIDLSYLYVFTVAFASPGAFDIEKLWASTWAFS